MRVYAESNDVLELALHEEQAVHCRSRSSEVRPRSKRHMVLHHGLSDALPTCGLRREWINNDLVVNKYIEYYPVMKREPRTARIRAAFEASGGLLRTGEALRAGIHPRDLYRMRDDGTIDQVSRGVYRLADHPPLGSPDLVAVALRVPRAVIALVSALHLHGLTTEIPHEVSIALPAGTARPRLDWPPLRVYRFSAATFGSGVEEHVRDGVRLRVYGAAKSIADCFRFRNRLGIQVAVEALRTGLEERKTTPAELLRAARVCRVERIMRPYLEALQ